MDKSTFKQHLLQATQYAYEFAREHVRDHLPERFAYMAHLNQSYDGNPLESGEHVFPDDIRQHGTPVGPLSAEQVVGLLWRDGLVPEWIDISVERGDASHTFMQLLCCGRFTDRPEHLYYRHTAVCPFGVKSPVLPPQWELGDAPFDLQWRRTSKA